MGALGFVLLAAFLWFPVIAKSIRNNEYDY